MNSKMTKVSTQIALAVLAFGLALLPCADAAATKQAGLVLEMESTFFGASTIKVSKDGIRIDSKKLGLVIVSHAPSWSVIAFNEKTKAYYEATQEEWRKRLASRTSSKQANRMKQDIKQTGTSKVAGQNTKIYRWSDFYTKGGGSKKLNPTITDFYASQSSLIPKQAAGVLASSSDLPAEFGLPLKITREEKGTKKLTLLNTTKCVESPLDKTIFFQPKGFKRVSSEVALIMDTGDDDEMDSLMNGLDK